MARGRPLWSSVSQPAGKYVLKPCCSSLDAYVVFTRRTKLKEMDGWMGCIPCNAPGFTRAASMVIRLYE